MKNIIRNIALVLVIVIFANTSSISNAKDTTNYILISDFALMQQCEFKLTSENSSLTRDGSKSVTDITYFVEDESIILEIMSAAKRRDNSDYKEMLDSTCSYLVYSTVYFVDSTINGKAHSTITKVTGGYTKKDWTVSVVSQNLEFGQVGGIGTSSYRTTKTPTGSTWSYTPPSSWKPVRTDGSSACRVGLTYIVELRRNAGSWTVELNNDAYNFNNASFT